MRLLILGLVAVVTLFLSACGGGERLSLPQYAQLCADGLAAAALFEPQDVTWGDLLAVGEPALERLDGVSPPDELSTFHRASLKAIGYVVEVAQEHPPEELANPLAFGLEAIRIATQLRRAVSDLPDDTRRALQAAGCL